MFKTFETFKLKDIQATWKSSGYEAVGGKESYIKERDKLSKKIKFTIGINE